MPRNSKRLCRRFGLRYVETAELTLRRRRCGKGFAYLGPDGRTVRDKTVKTRIAKLAIPPAWTAVCIADDERAHIQAIGRDAEGRLQYRYHPDWERARAETKVRRLLKLGTALPRLRADVRKALATPGMTRSKAIAAVVRLIDRALLRPGHEEYAQISGSRGASTLLKKDVAIEGDTIVLAFEGKGGKSIRQTIRDRLLADVTKSLSKLKGKRLFTAPGDDGSPQPITAREVNAFIAEHSGTDVSAKDFRTFRGSAEALAFLSEQNGDGSVKPSKSAIIEAADIASKTLANTRSVARSSYIHPTVITAYQNGKLQASLLRGRLRSGLSKIESALMRFLERKAV